MSQDVVELYRRLPVTASDGWWVDLAAVSTDHRVLYLGCGTGRLALPLTTACELLVGVDVDRAMLEAFAARLDERTTPKVRLVRGAAHEIALGERFGLVILPSSLLNGITDPGERAEVVRLAADHCRPDGQVVLQVLNPYWMAAQQGSGAGTLQPQDAGADVVEVTIDQLTFDAWEQRQTGRLIYRFADGRELTDAIDAIALYPRELRAMAFRAGLEIERTAGADPRTDALGREGGTWHLICRPREP